MSALVMGLLCDAGEHKSCSGGEHQEGVIGGWDCSCECHHRVHCVCWFNKKGQLILRIEACPAHGGEGDPSRTAERVASIPSHTSPPAPGEPVYVQIDRAPYKVAPGIYTGSEIRAFAHPPIGDDRDLWKVEPGENDRKIEDHMGVTIRTSGVRFFTAKAVINAGSGRGGDGSDRD